MARLYLTNEMSKALIAAGLVRDPDSAGTLPPCFPGPEEGPPAPDDVAASHGVDCDATVSLALLPGEQVGPMQGYREVRAVEIVVRAIDTPTADDLCQRIAEELEGAGEAPDARLHWMMGDLRVSNIYCVSPAHPVNWRFPGQGVTWSMVFRVGLRRSDLVV